MNISLDSDLAGLAASLAVAGTGITPALLPTVRAEGSELQKVWRANAKESSGAHGRLYPSSITTEVRLGVGELYAEVGPDPAKPQGGMGKGFEFGSANQPPHLDGARAFAVRAQPFYEAVSRKVDALLTTDRL